MTQHTPGPWTLEDRRGDMADFVVKDASGHPIAYVHEFSESDARLIDAAPGLLEMLARLCDTMKDSVEAVPGHEGVLHDLIVGTEQMHAYAEARALLKEIEGKAPPTVGRAEGDAGTGDPQGEAGQS